MGAETVGKVATASNLAGLYGINGTKIGTVFTYF